MGVNFSNEQLWGGMRVWKAISPSLIIRSAWLLSPQVIFITWRYSFILKTFKFVSQGCLAVSSSLISSVEWFPTMSWSSPLINTVRFALMSGGVRGSRLIFRSSVIPLLEVSWSIVSDRSEYAVNPWWVSLSLVKNPFKLTHTVLKTSFREGLGLFRSIIFSTTFSSGGLFGRESPVRGGPLGWRAAIGGGPPRDHPWI